MPRSHNSVLRGTANAVPYGIAGSNPVLGAFVYSKLKLGHEIFTIMRSLASLVRQFVRLRLHEPSNPVLGVTMREFHPLMWSHNSSNRLNDISPKGT